MKHTVLGLISTSVLSTLLSGSLFGFVNELRQHGYSLIPAPQKTQLTGFDCLVDKSWDVHLQDAEKFNAEWLRRWALEFHGLELEGSGEKKILLRVAPGLVKIGGGPGIAAQAYQLEIGPSKVEITGNSEQGLFYGVQSLLQLMRRRSDGKLTLPEGRIEDWPDLELRFVHWDFLHHQKRPETIRRLLDWLALFKVNFVGLEILDKYEFPTQPIVGCPGAYTKQELQDFTHYALERHIQLVPVVQSPGHFSYVLKHPEFAHLRADGNNYQACMCEEEAIQLIFDLYQDLIDATPGVDYFHVATDEVYYAGICAKCERPYNPENRSRTWLEFVRRAHDWLKERNRKMITWVEYPLLPEHVSLLPAGLINGVIWLDSGYPQINQEIMQGGNQVRQLSYTSMYGAELLFPNYFNTMYRGRDTEGTLNRASRAPIRAIGAGAEPLGSFAATWDTSGPHEETFWLGWITVSQYAWSARQPRLEQSVADFMDCFYGPVGDMVEIYRLLQSSARFFEAGWDRVPSVERPLAYGNSNGPGIGIQRRDLTLAVPPLEAADRGSEAPLFSKRYSELLAQARERRDESDRLIFLINEKLSRVERNRYNLEILLSMAHVAGHFPETLLALESAEQSLLDAAEAAAQGKPRARLRLLSFAGVQVRRLLENRERMWKDVVATWEKSRYPKNRDLTGRRYLDVESDVKDGFAGRRRGLDYLIAPYQRMDLEGWLEQLRKKIEVYGEVEGPSELEVE